VSWAVYRILGGNGVGHAYELAGGDAGGRGDPVKQIQVRGDAVLVHPGVLRERPGFLVLLARAQTLA
jgi:hypothetical protein